MKSNIATADIIPENCTVKSHQFHRKSSKILHVSLNGILTDGWSYQENLLTKYHKKLGYEVTIITSKWIYGKDGQLHIDDRNEYINCDGVKVVRLTTIGNTFFSSKFKRYNKLYESIDKEHPDILFIHSVAFCDVPVIVRYIKSHKDVIAYADNHADYSNSASNWISKVFLHGLIWRYYAHQLAPYIKRFYGVLPARVEFLKTMYSLPPEKCELLVMGADDELLEKYISPNYRKTTRIQHGISDSDFLVVTGGKINNYRPETINLMQAIKGINRDDIKLVVFGSVSDELKEEFFKSCDDSHVIFAGWLSSDDIYKLFFASDLIVFPGLHSVLWEQAVAQGKPCVFRDIEGFHHVDHGGNALFVSDVSIENLRRTILQIVDDPNMYESMKQAAESSGKNVFSYMNIAKKSIQYDPII